MKIELNPFFFLFFFFFFFFLKNKKKKKNLKILQNFFSELKKNITNRAFLISEIEFIPI